MNGYKNRLHTDLTPWLQKAKKVAAAIGKAAEVVREVVSDKPTTNPAPKRATRKTSNGRRRR